MKGEYLNLDGMYILSFKELVELIQDYCESTETDKLDSKLEIKKFLIDRGYESET